MNRVAVTGAVCAIGVIVWGIKLGSSLLLFVDLKAFLMGPVATAMLLIATFGAGTVGSALAKGFRLAFSANPGPIAPDESDTLNRVAVAGIQYATLTGLVSMLIGLVTVFQRSNDLSGLAPALAVALLSVVYAAIAVLGVFYPMARHATRQG